MKKPKEPKDKKKPEDKLLPPVAIQRIIKEIETHDKPGTGYNRTYHRHNR